MAEPGRQPREPIPERVRMPLLDLVTAGALDEDYRHVADQRSRGGEEPPRRGRGRIAAVVVAVFGVLVTTAAVQNSRNAEVAEAGRVELVDQINERRDDLAARQGAISDLREQNAELDDALADVVAADRTVSSRLLELEGRAGYAPVTGPGVRIEVDDAPDGDSDGVVRDEDLAILVDGLWAAGAEAIAVNDERLTALTAIRSVNGAIHVRTQPLRPPYTVLAVGNQNTLQARFVETSAGQSWYSLVRTFGLEFTMENAQGLSLPASLPPTLRSAVRLEDSTELKIEEAP